MDNRNNEFSELCGEMQSIEVPDVLSAAHTKKDLGRRAAVHRAAVIGKSFGAMAAALLMVLFVGVNASPAFAREMEGVPVISRLAKIFEINRGMEDVFFAEYAVKVEKTDEFTADDTDYKVELAYAAGDDTSLVMFLNADARGKHAEEAEIRLGNVYVTDTDTGEPVTVENYVGTTLKKGVDNYSCLVRWAEYHKNIRVSLDVYSIYSPDGPADDPWGNGYRKNYSAYENGEGADSADMPVLNYEFSLKEKDAPIVYDLDETFVACGEKFHIGQVRVYPLSTEVELSKPEDLDICSIGFSLTDGEGRVTREKANSMLSAHGSSAILALGDTYILQSGYYAFEDEMYLNIGKVEILHDRLKDVTLDLNTGAVCDADGIVKEVTYDRSKNTLTITRDFVWTYDQAYYVVYDEGKESWGGVSDSETSYEYHLPFDLVDSEQDRYSTDGIVKLERDYPESCEEIGYSRKLK